MSYLLNLQQFFGFAKRSNTQIAFLAVSGKYVWFSVFESLLWHRRIFTCSNSLFSLCCLHEPRVAIRHAFADHSKSTYERLLIDDRILINLRHWISTIGIWHFVSQGSCRQFRLTDSAEWSSWLSIVTHFGFLSGSQCVGWGLHPTWISFAWKFWVQRKILIWIEYTWCKQSIQFH